MAHAGLHGLRRLAAASVVSIAVLAANAGIAQAAVSPPSTLVIDHSNTACKSVDSSHNLQKSPQMSQTGIAFINGNLYVSCWGDTTITEIDPHTGNLLQVYTISAGQYKAFGALAYDPTDSLLFACASTNNVGTGSPENKMSEVGTISLSGSGGTFTPVFTASHSVGGKTYSGCDNGLAWDPGSEPGRANTLWTSGDLDTMQLNWTPNVAQQTATFNESDDVANLMGSTPATSGIVFGGGNFYIANQQSTTKRVYRVTPSFSSSTQVLSSTHRYEDMECDDQSFNTTVIWVMWFNQNILKPLPISGTCGASAPPPPGLTLTQAQNGPVTAGQNVDFTDTATNTDSLNPQTNLTISQQLPSNATYVSVNPSPGGVCSHTATTVSCSFSLLPASQQASMDVTLGTLIPGPVTSPATAQSDQAGPVSDSHAATVNAAPSVVYYAVSSGSFTPSTQNQPLGDSVQFAIEGSGTHDIADNSTHLYDSGAVSGPAAYDLTYTAAGSYSVIDTSDSKTATVNVVPDSPATGSLNTPIQITWANASLPGSCTETTQVQKPGTTKWVAWKSGVSTLGDMYTPTQKGKYKFRSKLVCSGGSTGFSTGTSTTIS